MYDTLIRLEMVDDARVATIGNEIDLANAAILERYLAEAAADVPFFIVSLAECRYIDSSGLRVFAHLAERLGGTFAVVAPPGTQVRRVIDIARFAARMRVCVSLREALFGFRSKVPA